MFNDIPRLDFFHRPFCMFAHHGFGVFQSLVENGQRVHVPGVAQCNRDVPQVAASLGAFDRSPLEALIKFLGCKQQFIG